MSKLGNPRILAYHNKMKRKFKTLGIIHPSVCDGSLLSVGAQRRIVSVLKDCGFRETRWQFIYENQVYGLVLPYENGKNEVHIRFYSDRVFTEYEIGRASFAHFLGPFLNANGFVQKLVCNSIADCDYKYLEEMMDISKLSEEETSLRTWNFDSPVNDKIGSERKSLFDFDSPNWISSITSWRNLVSVLSGICGIALLKGALWPLILAVCVVAVFLRRAVPQPGRP